jgi:hypothetical protein
MIDMARGERMIDPTLGSGRAWTGQVRCRPLIGDLRSRRRHGIERDRARLIRTDAPSWRLPATVLSFQQSQGYWHHVISAGGRGRPRGGGANDVGRADT